MKNLMLIMLLGLLSMGKLSADNYQVTTSVNDLGHTVHTYTTSEGEFVYTANQFKVADNLEVVIYKDANQQVLSTEVKGVDSMGNTVNKKFDSHLISRELSFLTGFDALNGNSAEGEQNETINNL